MAPLAINGENKQTNRQTDNDNNYRSYHYNKENNNNNNNYKKHIVQDWNQGSLAIFSW